MKLLVPKLAERILSAGLFLLASATLSFSQPTNLYTFPGPDVDLGQNDLSRVVYGGHYIGGRGDTVYVLRQFGSTYCHKSSDGGLTFGPGVQVNSTAGAYNASLKVDTAGIVYVAYQSGGADIYFTKSDNGGQSFIPGVKVNDDTVSQIGQERPAMAVNNKGQIFIAWGDQRNSPPPSTRNLFFSSSFDSGKTFSSNIQINDASLPVVWGIDIAVDDTARVYIVWNTFLSANFQGPVYLARSDDSGSSFPIRSLVSDLPSDTGWALFPSLAIAGTNVGVAWQDQQGFNEYSLHFAASNDYGQSFSPSIIVDNSGEPQSPSLHSENEMFYVAWRATHRRTPSGPDLDHMWFSYSRDSGKTFVPFVDAVPDDTNYAAVHFDPTIWVNETEKAFVAWTDTRWEPVFDEDHHLFVSVGAPSVTKGDLDFDGIIDLPDVVLEINAVFFGQSFPAPFHRADGNCDRKLTAVDVVLLLNRFYRNIPFSCS